MKKGITIINLSIIILLLAIITGTVVYTNSDSIKVTNKTKYVMELLDVQTKVNNYYIENGEYPIINEIEFDVSKFKEEELTQISGENVINNKIKLYNINLGLLGIKNTIYGNNKNNKDVYAFSNVTGRVYYIAGFNYNKIKYYTLTEQMYNGIDVSGFNTNYKEVRKKDIIFRVSDFNTIKDPIVVEVLVPQNATSITVTATNSVSVSTASIIDNYIKYIVNTTKLIKNYDVTVKYTLDGASYNVTYSVNGFDLTAPTIALAVVSNSGYTTLIITANDAEGEVVKLKYDVGSLTKEYFEKYGKTLTGNIINFYESGTYTVYAEDIYGNASVYVQNITVN